MDGLFKSDEGVCPDQKDKLLIEDELHTLSLLW